MTISSEKTKEIRRLLREEPFRTKAEIAKIVGVQRQRVYQEEKSFDENPYDNFDPAKLTAKREAKKWSMSKLARKARVSPSQVSRWEAGKQVPWPNVWRRIARALGCYVQDLEKDEVIA